MHTGLVYWFRVWDYLTMDSYNVAPFPVVQNIGPNLEFLASIGVTGHYADMTGGESDRRPSFSLPLYSAVPSLSFSRARSLALLLTHLMGIAKDRGMDMAALKLYLVGRKGLDLSLNTSRLTVEFTDGFYGKTAAVYVRRYIDTLGASMLKYGAAALAPSTDPNHRDANRGWEYSPVLGNSTFLTAADALVWATRAAASTGVAEYMDRTRE